MEHTNSQWSERLNRLISHAVENVILNEKAKGIEYSESEIISALEFVELHLDQY